MTKLNTNFFIDLKEVDSDYQLCSEEELESIRSSIGRKVSQTSNCPTKNQWEDYWSDVKLKEYKIPTFFKKQDHELASQAFRFDNKFILSDKEHLASDCIHAIIKNILNYLKADFDSIVEFGCGNGHNLEYIKSLNLFSNIYGCDFSESAVSIVKDKGFESFIFDMKSPSSQKLKGLNLNNEKTIFFTSGSMEQLGHSWSPFFAFLESSNVNYVFHIEPIIELYSDTGVEAMSKDFHKKKNYLQGYFSFLQEQNYFNLTYSKSNFGTLYDQGFNVLILKRYD
jgi:SAM-dependent methyltransferase